MRVGRTGGAGAGAEEEEEEELHGTHGRERLTSSKFEFDGPESTKAQRLQLAGMFSDMGDKRSG